MGRLLRTMLGIAAIVLLALVGIVVADSYLLGQGCDTELCCEGCSLLAVTKVIDDDTFASPQGNVRLFGIDTPELGVSPAPARPLRDCSRWRATR